MDALPAIVIDSREQLPYSFNEKLATTTRKALPAGDYSLVGQECNVAVERKTLADFVGTVINSRVRFRKELIKLSAYDRACVVVEATLEDVLSANYPSGAVPNAILGAALSIFIDYGVPVFFCGDRQHARHFTEKYLQMYNRRHSECKVQQSQSKPSVAKLVKSSSPTKSSVLANS